MGAAIAKAVAQRASPGPPMGDVGKVAAISKYTPYESPNLANQNSWKLDVFVWKLEGRHFLICYFQTYKRKQKIGIRIEINSLEFATQQCHTKRSLFYKTNIPDCEDGEPC